MDKIANSIEKLQNISKKFYRIWENESILFEELNKIDSDRIDSLLKKYSEDSIISEGDDEKKVFAPNKFLRRIILLSLKDKNQIDLSYINEYKKYIIDANLSKLQSYITNKDYLSYVLPLDSDPFLKFWNTAYNVLYVFFFQDEEKKLIKDNSKIILEQLYKDFDFSNNDNKIWNFHGPRKNGSNNIFIAIYPDEIETATEAFQLYIQFENGHIYSGIRKGNNCNSRISDSYIRIECNNYDDILKVLKDNYDKYIQLNKSVTESSSNSNDSNSFSVFSDNELKIVKEFKDKVINSKNVVFRGAPGTGKTYLAKKIATYIVSNESTVVFDNLTDEQKKRIAFVQFHPSYDYTDFVEGIRPIINDEGDLSFDYKSGCFKEFVDAAVESEQGIGSKDDIIDKYISDAMDNNKIYTMIKGDEFVIEDCDGTSIIATNISKKTKSKKLRMSTLKKMLYSGKKFENLSDIPVFLGKKKSNSHWSYYLPIVNDFVKNNNINFKMSEEVEPIKYVFIIDEINRGEISKIFGELFYAIDPDYRGDKNGVLTQYSKMHEDPDEKFYIPDNVYIIGTMNDIDRSVDTFDFAMRRRFRFLEIKTDSEYCDNILKTLGDNYNETKEKMISLNNEIMNVDILNENYKIGPAYFLKLKDIDFNQLWTDYLEPLLQEYVRGLPNENELMDKFKIVYFGNQS